MSEPIFKNTITIVDKHGFHYQVSVHHHPDVGTSIAYYRELRIANRNYGRHRPPVSDDDREWEEYETHFMEGIGGEIEQDFEYRCTEIFNQESFIQR